jgi:Coenzyme PQQ synthesis protein D (PqqD)
MDAARHFVVASNVVHETVDGEVVIVSLMTGAYFSLRGSASEIWDLMAQGARSGDIISAMCARHGVGPAEVEAPVIDFLGDLEAEQLIVVAKGEGGATDDSASAATGSETAAPSPFLPPRIEKFTDMQDLLLLDPIHDVDDEGWPVAKPAGDAPE